MNDIIDWCNKNVGFINAIVAIISSILSFIAIIISICTARLPYKKRIKLTQSYDFRYTRDDHSSEVKSHLIGISVNAANVGFRNINLTFLGLVIRRNEKPWEFRKMEKITENDTDRGIVEPTDITTVKYDIVSIAANFENIKSNVKIYILAIDSEGKKYYKCIGKKNIIEKYIHDNL